MSDEQSSGGQKGDHSRASDDSSPGNKSEWGRDEVDYQVDVSMLDGSEVTHGVRDNKDEQDKPHEVVEMSQTVETPDKVTTREFRPKKKGSEGPARMAPTGSLRPVDRAVIRC